MQSKNNKKLVQAMIFLVIFLLGIFLIWPLCSSSVQESDSGEMATAIKIGAIVHPPGYPLYNLIGRSLANVFNQTDPILILSRFSAIAQVLAVAIFFVALLNFSVPGLLAFTAAISWLLIEPSLRIATDADVFAFHNLIIAVLLLLIGLLKNKSLAVFLATLLCGLFFGLGLSHQMTIVLWLPLIIATGLNEIRFKAIKEQALFILSFCFAAILGLSPYLLLFGEQSGHIVYDNINTISGLFAHILRFQYGTFSWHINNHPDWVSYLPSFFWILISTVPLILAGIIFFIVDKKYDFFKIGIICTILLHIFFGLSQKLPPNSLPMIEFNMRFFSLQAVVYIFMAAFYLRNCNPKLLKLFALINLACLLWITPANLTSANANADRVIDLELELALREAPENSVLVATGDHFAMGLLYKQLALGRRPDLLIIVSALFNDPAYRSLVNKRLPEFKSFGEVKMPKFLETLWRANKRIVSLNTNSPGELASIKPLGILNEWLQPHSEINPLAIRQNLLNYCQRLPLDLFNIPAGRHMSEEIIREVILKPLLKVPELTTKIQNYLQNGKGLSIAQIQSSCRNLNSDILN